MVSSWRLSFLFLFRFFSGFEGFFLLVSTIFDDLSSCRNCSWRCLCYIRRKREQKPLSKTSKRNKELLWQPSLTGWQNTTAYFKTPKTLYLNIFCQNILLTGKASFKLCNDTGCWKNDFLIIIQGVPRLPWQTDLNFSNEKVIYSGCLVHRYVSGWWIFYFRSKNFLKKL